MTWDFLHYILFLDRKKSALLRAITLQGKGKLRALVPAQWRHPMYPKSIKNGNQKIKEDKLFCMGLYALTPLTCSTRWALQVGFWVLVRDFLVKSLLFGVIGFSRLNWYILCPSGYFSKKPWVFFQGKWYFKTVIFMLGMTIVSRSLQWTELLHEFILIILIF